MITLLRERLKPTGVRSPSFWPCCSYRRSPTSTSRRSTPTSSTVNVAFAVTVPRILGTATNIFFEGVISGQLPPGVTQEQAIAALKARDEVRIADMLSRMTLHRGQGVDFDALGAPCCCCCSSASTS